METQRRLAPVPLLLVLAASLGGALVRPSGAAWRQEGPYLGTVYDVGDNPAALEGALAAAGYDDLRREQAGRRAAGDPVALGIGMANYVEITAVGRDGELGRVEVLDGGRVRVVTGPPRSARATTPPGR